MQGISTAIALATLIQGLAACGSRTPVAPSPAPASVPGSTLPSASATPGTALVVFTDSRTGVSTTDVQDADGHVVQFSTGGELIWVADGSRLPGYRAQGLSIPAEGTCRCWLIVRFGTSAGERRAYLTADYGHDNPGTLVGLAVVNGRVTVSPSDVVAPGTSTLSGVITERTDSGPAPVQDAGVWRLNEERTGWQVARTDASGRYSMRGLDDTTREVVVITDGVQRTSNMVSINGDTRFDIEIVRR